MLSRHWNNSVSLVVVVVLTKLLLTSSLYHVPSCAFHDVPVFFLTMRGLALCVVESPYFGHMRLLVLPYMLFCL